MRTSQIHPKLPFDGILLHFYYHQSFSLTVIILIHRRVFSYSYQTHTHEPHDTLFSKKYNQWPNQLLIKDRISEQSKIFPPVFFDSSLSRARLMPGEDIVAVAGVVLW